MTRAGAFLALPSGMSASAKQLTSETSKFLASVLVVDDDPTTRLLAARLLVPHGYEVVQAGRIVEARELLRTRAISLVLVDGLLPDGTGVELITELREERPELPVVFLSAFYKDFRSYQELSKSLRVEGILHKPINPATLVAQVKQALAQGPLAPAS